MAEKRDDGGAAFPRTGEVVGRENETRDVPGMSLRDWFAGQALTGVVSTASGLGTLSPQDRREVMQKAAGLIFEFVDAMLEARKQ